MIPQKLRILILKHLAERPRAGYGLIKDIHERTGWKPSYGSIYPLLDHMREEGLVTFKEVGKKKVYSLTATGKKAHKELATQHDELKLKMQESVRLMSHMMGISDDRHEQMIKEFFNAMEKGDAPLKDILESSSNLKLAFWELYKKGTLKKNINKVNKILDKATEEIKALK